ncbi:MAG: helix-turn-helix domain-containing protein [Methanobacterium sp.]|nr:helix-turn-helix domain-containing protein [Methanobacterium sp.]
MVLKPIEKSIINALYFANKPLTTQKVADGAKISWQTAKNNLENLHKKGYVDGGKLGKSIYWWIKY